MRVLNVAEKPSVAKAISEILSQGHCSKVGGLRGTILRGAVGRWTAVGARCRASRLLADHLFSVDFVAAAAASAEASRSTIRSSSSATR